MIFNMISAYIQKYLLEIEFIQQFSFSFEIDFNVDLSQFNDFFSDYHPPTIDMSFIEDMNRKTYQFIVDEFINYNKKDKYFFKEILYAA